MTFPRSSHTARRLLLLLSLAAPAFAQNYTNIVAGSIADAGGGVLASGQMQFVPTDGNGKAISFRLPGGGAGLTTPVVCNVAGGVITGTCKLANTALTNPINVCYQVSIVDNVTGVVVRPSDACYQPTGAQDDFDSFVPNYLNLLPAQVGPVGPKGDAAISTANGTNGGFIVPGRLTAANVNGALNVNTRTGADLGAQIQVTNDEMGQPAGELDITQAGTISTSPVLSAGRKLWFKAPVNFAASIVVNSNLEVQCDANAVLSSSVPNLSMFTVNHKNNIKFTGCNATSSASGGTLASTSGGAVHVGMVDNNTTGMALWLSSGTGNVDFTAIHNSTTGSAAFYAIVLLNNIGSLISGNNFHDTLGGVEGWGGDANGGYTGAASVTLNGENVWVGNHCRSTGQACLWGSMMYQTLINNNDAYGCGDTCLDLEGSIDSEISHNTVNCTGGNFCYSVFFGADTLRFDNNIGVREDGGIISILKYNYGNAGPRNRRITFDSNTFTCRTTVCRGFYSEGDADLVFTSNTLNDAWVGANGYHANMAFKGNVQTFTSAPSTLTAWDFAGMAILGESRLAFEENTTKLSVFGSINPQFPAGSIGLNVNYADYNNSDFFDIYRNDFEGFPVAIQTTNTPLNVGPNAVPHMNTYIGGNNVGHGSIVHTATPMNGFLEDNYFLYGTNHNFDGTVIPGNTP